METVATGKKRKRIIHWACRPGGLNWFAKCGASALMSDLTTNPKVRAITCPDCRKLWEKELKE